MQSQHRHRAKQKLGLASQPTSLLHVGSSESLTELHAVVTRDPFWRWCRLFPINGNDYAIVQFRVLMHNWCLWHTGLPHTRTVVYDECVNFFVTGHDFSPSHGGISNVSLLALVEGDEFAKEVFAVLQRGWTGPLNHRPLFGS